MRNMIKVRLDELENLYMDKGQNAKLALKLNLIVNLKILLKIDKKNDYIYIERLAELGAKK